MSSLGGTILLHELVRPEAGLLLHPTRGWEFSPSVLAYLSHFSIMQPIDVLDQVYGSGQFVSLRQPREVRVTENLKPARGWRCVREVPEEWQFGATSCSILFNEHSKPCQVMHLFGVHRSQRRPSHARGCGIGAMMAYPLDPILWRWDWIAQSRQLFVDL